MLPLVSGLSLTFLLLLLILAPVTQALPPQKWIEVGYMLSTLDVAGSLQIPKFPLLSVTVDTAAVAL